MVSAKDGESAMMTKQEADSFLDSSTFKAVKKKADVPKVYWSATGLEQMSDIGGKFDSGCTGSLPHSRLIAGGITDSCACIISEQGGIVYLRQFKVFKNEDNKIKCIYTEMVSQDKRMDEIRKKLEG